MCEFNFEKLAAHLRDSEATLSISKLFIHTGTEDFRGTGKLQVVKNNLVLNVVLSDMRPLPLVAGTFKREQFWKIGGIIEEQVPFWALALPHSTTQAFARFEVHRGKFSFDRINHITGKIQDGDIEAAILEVAQPTDPPACGADEATAILTNYGVVGCDEESKTTEHNPFLSESYSTQVDTLRGEFGQFEYALIQRGKNCEVRMRGKKGYVPVTGELKRMFDVLLLAISFTHGQHAWPQFYQLRHEISEVEEWARPPNALPRSDYLPVTKSACDRGARLHSLIEKIMACLLVGDDFSEVLAYQLFLAREAGSEDTPPEVGTLGLCAVLEGMVALFFDKFVINEETQLGKAFQEVRGDLSKFIKEKKKASPSPEIGAALDRFAGQIGSTKNYRPIDKYKRLVDHFGLPRERMESAWKAWENQRNKLAHGSSSKNDRFNGMIDASRIAGGINILTLKAVGYSGVGCLSPLEDDYINLT